MQVSTVWVSTGLSNVLGFCLRPQPWKSRAGDLRLARPPETEISKQGVYDYYTTLKKTNVLSNSIG